MSLYLPGAFNDNAPVGRQRIEQTIERLIALLNDLEDDADLEPWLGAVEFDGKPSVYLGMVDGWPAHALNPAGDQRTWARSGSDDREEPDEDGGDIQDEPHDEEPDTEDGGDAEPSLGWPTPAPSLAQPLDVPR